MRVSTTTRWPRILCLIAIAGTLFVTTASEAGKPGPSHPLTVVGVDPYVETPLFTSDDALLAAQAGVDAEADLLALLYGLEVDPSGAVYSIFLARDSTNTVYVPNSYLPRKVYTGLVRWDGGSVDIAHSTFYTYDGLDGEAYDEDLYAGEWIYAVDAVPPLDSGASGGLAPGDLVVLRWMDDDPSTMILHDDLVEVVQFTPTFDGSGSFSGLTEVAVLQAFPQAGGFGGRLAVDPLGRIYVRIPNETRDSEGRLDSRLWLLEYDAVAESYGKTDVEPISFEMDSWIEVDETGALYVQGKDWQENSGTIFKKPLDGPWAPYASFKQKCCIEAFQAWTYDASV